MSENFNFYGQTTFINRPVDTVIQDFQNSYASVIGQEDLSRLLRLVLSSQDLPDDTKEDAAATVDEVAKDLVDPQPNKDAVHTKLEKLRTIVSRAADIAVPALQIIAAVLILI